MTKPLTHSLIIGTFQVALVAKNLPISEGDARMWVPSLGREDPLEEEMATPSSTPGRRSLAGYRMCGCKGSDMTEQLRTHTP